MSALPEVSSHIADIGRQLNGLRAGCITGKKGLRLVLPQAGLPSIELYTPFMQINRI